MISIAWMSLRVRQPPRVPSRALADLPGASTWRGGDDEYRQVGSLVSGQ